MTIERPDVMHRFRWYVTEPYYRISAWGKICYFVKWRGFFAHCELCGKGYMDDTQCWRLRCEKCHLYRVNVLKDHDC